MNEAGAGINWRGARRRLLLAFAVLTFISLVSFSEMYLGPFAYERKIAWHDDLILEMIFWYCLLPAVPLIYWLAQRWLIERPHLLARVSLHLAASLVYSLIYVAFLAFYLTVHPATAAWYASYPFPITYFRVLNNNLHFYMVVYWAIVGSAHAARYYQSYRERERQAAELQLQASQLQAQLAQAELQALRMQIQPHFLFNTLHSIAALVREGDKKAAVNMIVGLSDLLRLSLDKSGSQEVPLRQELEFVQKYLEIEQVRFQDRLTVAFDIEPAATKTQVPYLILQPLVENAIRHGISRRAGAAILEIKARLEGDRLCLEVRDNGPGLRGAGSGIGAGGLGLKIVRDRLRQHYGLRHSFELRDAEGGGASAIIRFPPPAAGGRNAAEADVAPKAPAVEEPPASEAIVCREDNQ